MKPNKGSKNRYKTFVSQRKNKYFCHRKKSFDAAVTNIYTVTKASETGTITPDAKNV